MSAAPATDERWTVRRAVLWTTDYLKQRGADSPRTDAELLLADSLGVDRVRLVIDFDKPLGPEELAGYRGRIERRAGGEPIAYILGRREFYGRRFAVDPRVLIPRPETEGLVELALALVPPEVPVRILDLCTGSGCVGLTLAAELPHASVTLVDLDAGAAEVARANAASLGLEARCELLVGDLLAPLPQGATFDLVVANPPYVATGELAGLQREVQREPRLALDGGADGLELVRRIVRGAGAHLSPAGSLLLELAIEQGTAVGALLSEAGFEAIRVEQDFTRRDRYVVGRRK